VRDESIAFCGDGSEYSDSLEAGFRAMGLNITAFERSDDLGRILDDTFIAVLIVSPHTHQARATRGVMDKAGGWASRIPLMAAIRDVDLLAETETLKYFDDLVVRPGTPEEVIFRVRILGVRRGKEGNAMAFGDLVINVDAHQVVLGGKPVDLTYKEYELLKMLAATPGRAYTREELLKSIWGYDYFGGTRTVDVHVRRLRAKIETSRQYIETVHGVGYRFTGV
jgi:DNA-binding response OmpR family regulator